MRSSTVSADQTAEASQYNDLRQDVIDCTGNYAINAGENMSAGEACYVKASDGLAYKSDADADESTYSYIGIIAINVTTGNPITIYKAGAIASGVTAGTIGQRAFLSSTAGALSNTPNGTRYAEIGIYVTTTSVLLRTPRFIRGGKQDCSSVTNYTQTTGFYPAKITIYVAPYTANLGGMSVSVYPNTVGNQSVAAAMRGSANQAIYNAYDWNIIDTNAGSPGTTINKGYIGSVTNTGFQLQCLTATSPVTVVWIAEN